MAAIRNRWGRAERRALIFVYNFLFLLRNSRRLQMPSLSPTFVSLFSGCGGLDHGFLAAGYEGLASVDIDEVALGVHKRNLKSPVQLLDLSAGDPVLGRTKKIDVLLAGSPCQGFSTIGKRRFDDPRNQLLWVAARFARSRKPKVIVVENVPGALSGEHRSYWDSLHSQLREIGYATCDLPVDCSQHGVAQKRRRIFLIAWRTSKLRDIKLDTSPRMVVSDVISNLDGVSNHHPVLLPQSSDDLKIASRIGPGQKLTNARAGDSAVHTWDIPEVFGATTKQERSVLALVLKLRRQQRRRPNGDADPVSTQLLSTKFGPVVIQRLVAKNYLRQVDKYHDLTHTFNGKYRRLNIDAPSHTVDTRFGDPRLFLHPKENRGLTVREAARIQGFDDSFMFSGTAAQQYRMVGNAVPPPVAKKIAELVRTLL